MSDWPLSTYLAIFGLLLAVAEMYFPRMSLKLEAVLDLSAAKLKPVYRGIGGASQQIHGCLSKTLVGRYYADWHDRFLWLFAIPLIVIFGQFEEQFESWPDLLQKVILLFALLPALIASFLTIPLSLYIYLYPIFYLFFKVVSLLLYVIERSIWLANFIGRGKGLSGIGLLMAFHGVLTAQW